MREDLERFVASLAIPADRKTVVLAELLDHVASAREAAVRDGRDADEAERAALGNLEALRRSLEAVEPAFRIPRWHAIARGVVASIAIALVIDQGGALMRGPLGALVALALGIACAPRRALELLRAELRARGARVARVPIGPAIAYLYTVLSGPFVLWIGLIVFRAFAGTLDFNFDVPISSFAVMAGVYALLFVEAFRARREAMA